MLIYDDPDRYETVSSSTTCPFHEANPGKAFAGCTCGAMIGRRKVSDEEYRKRRTERIRREDDEILRKADAIRAKRGQP